MCGLFGAVGKNVNYGYIRALALANQDRGTDAVGFFDSNGTIVKADDSAKDALADHIEMREYLKPADRWYICGHTRWGTRGANIKENAHPFQYGEVIGSHNGMVPTAPAAYDVDSEYLFDLLDIYDNDYQSALDDVAGSFALTWSYRGSLYLLAHHNPIAVAVDHEASMIYYSSQGDHLRACTGAAASYLLPDDAVWRFSLDGDVVKFETLPSFVSKAASFRPRAGKCGVQVAEGTKAADATDGGIEFVDEEANEVEFDASGNPVDFDPVVYAADDRFGTDEFISTIDEYDSKVRGLGYRNLDDYMECYGFVTLDQTIQGVDAECRERDRATGKA